MELSAARVFVSDLESAKQFYGKRLGLQIRADGSEYGYCVFMAGSADLVVESVVADAPEEDKALVGRFTGLSFKVPDVEVMYRELAALGVRFTGLPERQHWGGVIATLQDPSGNELQIAQYPAAA